MAHTGIFATKAEIDLKVGERVDTTGYTETNINNACKQAEGVASLWGKYDFATNWSNLNSVTRAILSEFEACWVAVDFIAYNMEAYGSRIQAEDLINLNNYKIKTILKMLEGKGVAEFIKNGA